MFRLSYFCILLGVSTGSFAQDSENMGEWLNDQRYKKAITHLEESLTHADKDAAASLKLQLAQVHFLDQNIESSLKVFLELLEETAPKFPGQFVETDRFTEAFELYMSDEKAEVVADIIIKQYEDYHNDNKDDVGIALLLSTAYANVGDFVKFYPVFYEAYSRNTQHYLIYKVIAALHIKLSSKSKTESEKFFHNQKILNYAQLAINQFQADPTLYQWQILFADDSNKQKYVKTTIDTIVEKNIKLSRSNIHFFLMQAIDANQLDLAQKLIDRARTWYHYSRALDRAQKQLNAKP